MTMDVVWEETPVLNFYRHTKAYHVLLSVYLSDDVADTWEWMGTISIEGGSRSYAEDYAPTLAQAKAAVEAWFEARKHLIPAEDTHA